MTFPLPFCQDGKVDKPSHTPPLPCMPISEMLTSSWATTVLAQEIVLFIACARAGRGVLFLRCCVCACRVFITHAQ